MENAKNVNVEVEAKVEGVVEAKVETVAPVVEEPVVDEMAAVNELMAQAKNIGDVAKKVGLEVRVEGTWVFIGGDTKPHKELLKKMGLRWSRKKSEWYYKGADLPDGYRWDKKSKSIVKVVAQ